jgi:hypothetical protein
MIVVIIRKNTFPVTVAGFDEEHPGTKHPVRTGAILGDDLV